jgi:hypothetical protein
MNFWELYFLSFDCDLIATFFLAFLVLIIVSSIVDRFFLLLFLPKYGTLQIINDC